MLLVVLLLHVAPLFGDGDRIFDRFGHLIGIHDHAALDIARSPSAGLDEGGFAAQKALLIGIEDGHQGDFGNVEPFAQQVDAHQHIKIAAAQIANDLHPLDGVDIGMEIFGFDIQLCQIFGEIFGQALCQSGDEDTAPFCCVGANFGQGNRRPGLWPAAPQSGDREGLWDGSPAPRSRLRLPASPKGLGWPKHRPLGGCGYSSLQISAAGCRRRGEAEAKIDQGCFARAVAIVHGMQLRNRLVRLVDNEEKILWENSR